MDDIENTIKKMEAAYVELSIKIDDVKTLLFNKQLELIAMLKNEVIGAAKELNRDQIFRSDKVEQSIIEHENLITAYAQLLNSWKNVQETLPKMRDIVVKNH
jgi:hypothetical protein